MPARFVQALIPRAVASRLLLPRALAMPTSRCRTDARWDCGLQRQQWLWWPAAVDCAVQHSFTVIGTDSRDGSYGRFLTVLSIYVGPDANRLSLEGIPKNDEWKNWLRTQFSAHHKPKYIAPISANAGVPCTMESVEPRFWPMM